MSSGSQRVGCRALQVDDGDHPPVAAWLLYRTLAKESTQRFGPYSVDLAMEGAPEGRGLPLVVVSHGTGGTPWGYRDLARFLARAGFAVALIEHPGNSRNDDRLAGTIANLENRPRHATRVVDAALGDPRVGPSIAAGGFALIGHSMGGYTALAVAGGRPWALPHETPGGAARRVEVEHDPRVRALVLLAPATPWFVPDGSLSRVEVPILLLTAEHDPHTPAFHGSLVERSVRDPAAVDAKVVAGAGHFAFMSPFPEGMIRKAFLPSQDPPGFDRALYQTVLQTEVLAFLQRRFVTALPSGKA